MVKFERQYPSDIIIESIKIKRLGSDQEYVVKSLNPKNDDEAATSDSFTSMSISESIFGSGVSGILKFREPSAGNSMIGDYFNFVGGELVEIVIESPEPIENSRKELTFCVNDVQKLGNEASEALVGAVVKADAGWLVSFISCENFYLNWAELDIAKHEDYIGHIASDSSFDEEPGLVNQVAEKYFNPGATDYSFAQNDMEIENTHNSVWIKTNQHMYPWAKDVHYSSLMSTMTDLAENAVTEDQKGVNYLFYADLDGWHFKSIRKMLTDEGGSYFFGLLGQDPREYFFTDITISPEDWNFGDPRVLAMNILNEYNHLQLWYDGAYSSYYELVKPNYNDPYFNYLNFASTHSTEHITYDYHQDPWGGVEDGGRVAEHKLLPDSIDTSPKIHTRRFYDENGLYGYFSNPYNAPQYNLIDTMGSMDTNGKYGPTNGGANWRTMFDQTDLSGEILYKIQKEIKKPMRESGAFGRYIKMVDVKERWEIYKNSICCVGEETQSAEKFAFLAIIDGAKKISGDDGRGGIYEYSWREVEFWPRDRLLEEEMGDVIEISDENSPLSIIMTPGGLQGTFLDEASDEWTNPAYNISELLNTTQGDDVLVGPGINAASRLEPAGGGTEGSIIINNYPEAFQMMPVGSYFITGDEPCETRENDDVDFYFHGQIVQMYKLTNYALQHIAPDVLNYEEDDDREANEIANEVYFFNVPNAHDGMCRCDTPVGATGGGP